MRYTFDYEILGIDTNGLAQIRYSNTELGKVVRVMFLPVDKGLRAVNQEILYRLPRDHYRSVLIQRNQKAQDTINLLRKHNKGSFEGTIDDDGFADTALEIDDDR